MMQLFHEISYGGKLGTAFFSTGFLTTLLVVKELTHLCSTTANNRLHHL